jgi:hypothetical protein
MNKDILSGGALLGVAGLYYVGTRQIARSSLEDGVGADGLPMVLAILLAVLALLLILRSFIVASPSGAAPADGEYHAKFTRALGLLAIAGGYAVIAPIIGYVPALALLIAAVALYEGAPPSWRLPVVAILGAGGFWLFFVWLLGVEQPSSLLF